MKRMTLLFAVVGMMLVLASGMAMATSAPSSFIKGTPGKDKLVGTNKGETIKARGGNDLVKARGGNDVIQGNRGSDTIFGGRGKDTVYGGPGNDTIYLKDGKRDVFDCGSGRDVIFVDRFDVPAPSAEPETGSCEVFNPNIG